MKDILKTIFSRTKKHTFVAIASLFVTLLASAIAYAGWSPNRPVFDWNNPDHKKGSMNGPVWNSFINTPYYGDERAFLDAARTDQASGQNAFKDVLPSVTEGSKEVILRTYIHNNANQSTNGSNLDGPGVAKNAKVRIDLPTGTSTMLRARSYISSSNAATGYPTEVTDTTELVDTAPFSIEYVPDSAIIYNGAHQGGLPLHNDSIVGSGAAIGYDQMNGSFPGCFEFQAFVEIRVKIKTPNVEFSKQVRKAGDTTYGELATIKPGDKVQWMISFKNSGAATIDDVDISDQMPPHMQLVPGSVRYIYKGVNGTDEDVVQSNTQLFTTGGLTTGSWKPNGGFFVRFDSTAKDDFEKCEVLVRNIAFYKSKQTRAEKEDTADVKIVKENCKPEQPKQPEFRCESLNPPTLLSKPTEPKQRWSFTTTTVAKGGATVKQYRYEIVGNNGFKFEKMTNNVKENGKFDFEFPATPDTYVVRVTVDFDVPDKGVQSDSGKGQVCQRTITVPKEEEKCPVPGKQHLPKGAECDSVPPTTTPPEELPKTGIGDLIGIFAATTVAGTLAHKFFLGRRYQ